MVEARVALEQAEEPRRVLAEFGERLGELGQGEGPGLCTGKGRHGSMSAAALSCNRSGISLPRERIPTLHQHNRDICEYPVREIRIFT